MSKVSKTPKNTRETARGSVRKNYKGGRNRALQIRASDGELQVIAHMARRYTGGNVGRWLRFAAMNFELTKAEEQLYEGLLKKASGE